MSTVTDMQTAAELVRLIQSNKELLESLKDLVSYVENNLSSDHPSGIDIHSRWFGAAHAAIAAAEVPGAAWYEARSAV